MNEQISSRERVTLDALCVETGETKSKEGKVVPYTSFWLGRFIEPVTLFRNGVETGEMVQLSGEIVNTEIRYRSGSTRGVRFLAKAEVVT